MTKGVLVVARNNESLDYIKQASFLAKQAKKFLGLPTSVITDSVEYIYRQSLESNFDNIIPIVWKTGDIVEGKSLLSKTEQHNLRRFYDGSLVAKTLPFKNGARTGVYDVTPYDETILIDTDMFIMDDDFKHCFEQEHDFLIYDKSYDLAGFRDPYEFKYISHTSVKFYWATVVFFRKTPENKIFFELLNHIQENWFHYRSIFQIPTVLYRNDHAFSIAIHIMNGYQEGNFSMPMPGKLFFTTDKDILWNEEDNKILFLLEKEDRVGEYTVCKWQDKTIHVMNKFSLERYIDGVTND
jgi:hypothetical protein